jgi:DNA-binding CsgD family transcriptional regulator
VILGRSREKEQIEEVLAQTVSGAGSSLVVVGEPGMGKTTLLDWVASGVDGTMRVLRAEGRESESDLPFVALADLIRPINDDIAMLTSPQARVLRSALAMSEPAPGDRLAMNTAVLHLLAAVAAQGPVLVLIDDYQWLDTATRTVIDYAARRSEIAGVGIIITTRGVVPEEHGGIEMTLQPLSADLAADLVSQTGDLTPAGVRRVVELAAGNPLALIELAKSLSEDDLAKVRPVEVSATLRRAFRNDLDRLSETARLAVLCAAEDETGDAATILAAGEALGASRPGFDEAVAAGLLIETEGVFRFRHPLVRSVAHHTADPAVVRSIHKLMAEIVDDPDRQAWHLSAAAEGPDDLAALKLVEFADRALDRGAAASAAFALHRAAHLSPSREARNRRLVAAARAAHRSGNMAYTRALVEQARATGDRVAADPTLLLLEADMRMREGDFAEAYGSLRLEAARISGSDPHRAVAMLLVAAKLRIYRYEGAAALAEVEEALALIPESEWEVVHHAALAMARTMAGHPGARTTAVVAMEEALVAPHGHIHSSAIGWPLIWLEEYELAQAFLLRSTEIQREGGFYTYLPLALLPLAELEWRIGRWDEARTHVSEALRLLEESHQPIEAAFALALLARLEAAGGDPGHALQLATSSRPTTMGLPAVTTHSEAASGFIELGVGNHLEAVRRLEHCVELAERGGTVEPLLLSFETDLAEALVRSGQRERGAELAQDLIRRFEDRPSVLAAALRASGLAAEGEFRDLFEQALAIHESVPTPFERARTLLAYGERLRRAKNRVAARGALKEALAVFDRLGATPWIERALAELEVSGETLDRSVDGLTRQERQVAAIVASGATNQEAAAKLFVNRKTIEFHLGNVYRKLGVRSRTELANVLRPDR